MYSTSVVTCIVLTKLPPTCMYINCMYYVYHILTLTTPTEAHITMWFIRKYLVCYRNVCFYEFSCSNPCTYPAVMYWWNWM